MKRFFSFGMVVMVICCLSGCKSNERKAEDLIRDYMFKHLHDYDSYEVVETRVDTAYNLPIFNASIRAEAQDVKDIMDDIDDIQSDMESAQRSMEIWGDSWSSYSRREYNEARDKWLKNLDNYVGKMTIIINSLSEINEGIKKMDSKEVLGWLVSHKFRCNTRGGNRTLGDYTFVMDKSFKNILLQIDDDDEDISDIVDIIKLASDDEQIQSMREANESLISTIQKNR